MKWFKVYPHRNTVTAVDVVRATGSSVWIEGDPRRHSRVGSLRYFDNFEEAHRYVLEKLDTQIAGLRHRLQITQRDREHAATITEADT